MRNEVSKTEHSLEKIEITGIVQGVGFRPFVYNLARTHRLSGYVMNNTNGVVIEVEGNPDSIEAFMIELEHEAPVLARIERIKRRKLNVGQTGRNHDGFEIHSSEHKGKPTALISPDVCVCESCLMKQRCLGSCVAQNYYRSGDLFAPFWFCDLAQAADLFPESRQVPTRFAGDQ